MFWYLFLSVVFVVAVTVLFGGVFQAATKQKREGLREAARFEYEEMAQQEGWNGKLFMHRSVSEEEEQRKKWAMTESGRELLKLEQTEKWAAMVGALVAIVIVVIYWKVVLN